MTREDDGPTEIGALRIFPIALKEDPEDVSWALSTAEAMWLRGDHAESVKWLRRAAEAASECDRDDRALSLAKAAAELSQLSPVEAGRVVVPKPEVAPAPVVRKPEAVPPPPKPGASVAPVGPPPLGRAPASAHGRGAPPAPVARSVPPKPAPQRPAPAQARAPAPRSATRPEAGRRSRRSRVDVEEVRSRAPVVDDADLTSEVHVPIVPDAETRHSRPPPPREELTAMTEVQRPHALRSLSAVRAFLHRGGGELRIGTSPSAQNGESIEVLVVAVDPTTDLTRLFGKG